MARKPVEGSITENVIKYGVGGINIDECRVGTDIIGGGTMPDFRDVGKKSKEAVGIDKLSFGQVENAERKEYEEHIGRFPANIITDGSEEVAEGFPHTKSTGGSGESSKVHTFKNTYNGGWGHDTNCSHLGGLGDEGSAMRYFYCAKASKKDRDEGLDKFDIKTKVFNGQSSKSSNDMKDVEKRFTTKGRNIHPTVKPTELMQYLVRLVSPKGATILDPFMGSGSTGKAVMFENRERNSDYKFIGVEMTDEYLPICESRIKFVCNTEDISEEISISKTDNKPQVNTDNTNNEIVLW